MRQETAAGLKTQGKALVVPAPSPTVAPYFPSAHPYVFAIVVSLRCRGRSSVGAAFDQQVPDDASHLVGQSDGDQHFRLARQHLHKPGALGCPAPIPPIGLTRHLSIPLTQPEFFSDGDTRAVIIFADIWSSEPSLEMLEA